MLKLNLPVCPDDQRMSVESTFILRIGRGMRYRSVEWLKGFGVLLGPTDRCKFRLAQKGGWGGVSMEYRNNAHKT